jgi:glycosyltransferase involved in cell wall biosynthesis
LQISVAVIIPSYNRAELLCRAIDSVLAQTYAAAEIIVVDDGSNDQTGALIPRYYPQVRYLYQPNRGVSAARNRGIAHARSPWLALLDSDDVWLPQKLERQLSTLPQDYFISHTDEIWIRRGKRVNPMKKHAKAGGWIYRHCLPICAISPSAVVIHRSVFEQVGHFDENLPACEDYDLWLRICARYPVYYLDEPLLLKYGGHDDQLSQKYWGMDRFRIQALEKILEHGQLNPVERQATLVTLIDKLTIYGQGASRRGKLSEAAHYLERREHYRTQLHKPSENSL